MVNYKITFVNELNNKTSFYSVFIYSVHIVICLCAIFKYKFVKVNKRNEKDTKNVCQLQKIYDCLNFLLIGFIIIETCGIAKYSKV